MACRGASGLRIACSGACAIGFAWGCSSGFGWAPPPGLSTVPTIAAAAYKHSLGQPFTYPRNDLSYCSNLLHMFFAVPAEPYTVPPVLSKESPKTAS